MKVDPNGPAYPVHCQDNGPSVTYFGIPLRLAIAAQIMAGFAADPTTNDDEGGFTPDAMAIAAIAWADALIEAYNQ